MTRRRTYSNAHTPSSRDQPTPHRRRTASSLEGIHKSRRYGREQATDTDGEGEGRQVSEFTLEHRLVPKLRGERLVGIVQVLQVHRSHALRSMDLYYAGFPAVLVSRHGCLWESGCVQDNMSVVVLLGRVLRLLLGSDSRGGLLAVLQQMSRWALFPDLVVGGWSHVAQRPSNPSRRGTTVQMRSGGCESRERKDSVA